MESSTLTRITTRIDQTFEAVKALKLPAFDTISQHDLSVQKEVLVAHRFLSKYEIPGGDMTPEHRRDISILEVFKHDACAVPNDFNWRNLPQPTRGHFLMASEWLRDFFKGFTRSYDLRFPTGEGFTSSHGEVDLYYKLSKLKYWSVSPDLVGDCVEIISRNRLLLRVVKEKYRQKYADWKTRLLSMRYEFGPKDRRKGMIKFMFLGLVTLNRTSRVTTVPKNNSRDRVITCESLWTMIAQLSYASDIKRQLLKKHNVDLDNTQQIHRLRIMSGVATIDFSKASDSNWMIVLRQLWPSKQYKQLERLRTGIFETSEGFTPLNMFAPMGCGCTFEVMTLTLLAHAMVLDSGASVFGDDVIIASEAAAQFCTNVTMQGWKVNQDKSFLTGNFRESCGGFVNTDHREALLSYDLRRPTDLNECFIFAHKVLRIGRSLPYGSLRQLFVDLYVSFCKLFPSDSLEPINGGYCYDTNAPLSETCLHVPVEVWRNRNPRRVTKVSALISVHWQRPVYVTMVSQQAFLTKNASRLNKHVLLACYFNRNMSYDIPTSKSKAYNLPYCNVANTALRNVALLSVL